MENLKLTVKVYPGNSAYQFRLTDLIQEGWFIVNIITATKIEENGINPLLFTLEKGCE